MATSSQRGWNNGRQPAPAYYERTKLTPQQRDEIRRRIADGETVTALAVEFGVSTRTIRSNS
ncbi:helix-turn-helix domain-containing protein [Streptomyces sp. NPDC088812]|uniref:helix-turn-helix domain-containing protein n=1 Tax=Streptomyces sp. NPDC088812 TaxID=3365905 RepID=UPI0038106457